MAKKIRIFIEPFVAPKSDIGDILKHIKSVTPEAETPVTSTEEVSLPKLNTSMINPIHMVKEVFCDEEKRYVTVFFYDNTRITVKCAPEDTFSLSIGVAIALYKYSIKKDLLRDSDIESLVQVHHCESKEFLEKKAKEIENKKKALKAKRKKKPASKEIVKSTPKKPVNPKTTPKTKKEEK